MEFTKKIYPSAEELSKVNTTLHCPEEGCNNVFSSESNLNLHIMKTHKKESLLKSDINKEFYCPEKECIYNEAKFFKSMKFLKQHYLKVHSEKSFICDFCSKGFPTQSAKNSHLEYCGVSFKCCDCDASYSSYETLLTHGRRKKHTVLEKSAYKALLCGSNLQSSSTDHIKKMEVILPKVSASYPVLNYIVLKVDTIDKWSQTEAVQEIPEQKSKVTQVNKYLIKENDSKHTQTCELTRTSSSIETQTIGDYFIKKIKALDSLNLEDAFERKDTTTQTKHVSSDTKSCNTSFKEEEFKFIREIEKNSLGTQTADSLSNEIIASISTATHDSIHTDTSDLNFEFMDSGSQTNLTDEMNLFDSSSFFNCNIETQTEYILENEFLNYADCSTIQTQTNVLLNLDSYNDTDASKECDILLNNIHTQTVFDDISRSVESQTMLSQQPKTLSFMSCRDYANMETQTDIDFRNMLEEINA